MNKLTRHASSLLLILLILVLSGCSTPASPVPVVPTDQPPVLVPTQAAAETPTVVPVPTASPAPAAPANGNFNLTILHTNDVHAHHAPNSYGDGGEALASSVINQVRAARPNTLLLSGGDTFNGTLFYVMHHGTDSAELMNALQYDAMTVGNHEFDEGNGNLALFIEKLNFPVLAANLTIDSSDPLSGKIKPYVIIEKGGEKIGVIGLANPGTPEMSRPGSSLVFGDKLTEIVQANADELSKAGVNKIILISHNGFQADTELAAAVHGVDVIVGGHSHTLLASYDTRAAGVYPSAVMNPDKKPVLVVQAGEYLQYIGRLDLEFDPSGDIVSYTGGPVFLSHYITPDPAITAMVDKLYEPVSALTKDVIGQTSVYLEGDRKVCRVQECNLGNLITDAMRAETGAQVAFENGGGIRASIKDGPITLGDVLTVLPFGNLVSTLSLSGADLLAALENGASKMEETGGRFLQVSGLRYEVDPAKPAGSRVLKVEILDEKGNYLPLNLKTMYTAATNDFISEGGDGFTIISENGVNVYNFGRPLDEVLSDYIKSHQPVNIQVEGRITIK